LRRFPHLELLDSEAVPKIAFGEPGPSTLPPPNPTQGPSSFPVDMNGGLVALGIEEFVGSFLYRFELSSHLLKLQL
jgi:nuclear RNA export factor